MSSLTGSSISLLIIVALLSLNLSLSGVEGARERISASPATKQQQQDDEDVEFEAQLKILNKPPVKTIQMEEGDIFDCIDIYKQPAFENPLLKNHKIQMRPSFDTTSSSSPSSSVLKRLACPQGTVPIRRTTKDDLNWAKTFTQMHRPATIHPLTAEIPGRHLAFYASKEHVKTFYGVRGKIVAANPKVGNGQFSAAQVWLEAGPPGELNSIQAGWAVAPSLFGDNQTRTFAYWSKDLHITGCYNFLCPGFVQVDKEVTIGTPIQNIADVQYASTFTVTQDKDSGNWWLQIDDVKVGYWPKTLFGHLNEGASQVAFGGLALGTANGPSPQMGNGYFPDGVEKACSIGNLHVKHDLADNWVLDESEFGTFSDATNCYKVQYDGVLTKQGSTIEFGGPGGSNCGA